MSVAYKSPLRLPIPRSVESAGEQLDDEDEERRADDGQPQAAPEVVDAAPAERAGNVAPDDRPDQADDQVSEAAEAAPAHQAAADESGQQADENPAQKIQVERDAGNGDKDGCHCITLPWSSNVSEHIVHMLV